MQANVKKAVAGAFHGRAERWYRGVNQAGALGYFGQDERIAGRRPVATGPVGAKKAVCVIQEQGHVGLEARCQGRQGQVPERGEHYITGTDMPEPDDDDLEAAAGQEHRLRGHAGAPFALAAVPVGQGGRLECEGRHFRHQQGADLGDQSPESVPVAVDQQPYLQGYLAVDSLWLYKTNGNTIGGGQAS